jgi:hypothetical protein
VPTLKIKLSDEELFRFNKDKLYSRSKSQKEFLMYLLELYEFEASKNGVYSIKSLIDKISRIDL